VKTRIPSWSTDINTFSHNVNLSQIEASYRRNGIDMAKEPIVRKFDVIHKPDVRNVGPIITPQRRNEPRPQATRKENLANAGVSEQLLNGTSAHNRPFQCHANAGRVVLEIC